MPHPGLPPTPITTKDIDAKDSVQQTNEAPFTLPSPALSPTKARKQSSGTSYDVNQSSNSALSTITRKHTRSITGVVQAPLSTIYKPMEHTLPPPPTRPRKIIQVKPGADGRKAAGNEKSGKKNSAATQSSKKAARKTAHSIIERRRRSKINEEFDTMKDLIPACRGPQTMHKLAILQAGIDYIRYLEQCVTDLKTVNGHKTTALLPPSQAATPRAMSVASSRDLEEDEDEEAGDSDQEDEGEMGEEMEGVESSANPSPVLRAMSSRPSPRGYTVFSSPAFHGEAKSCRSESLSSSTLPSPAIEPQADGWYHVGRHRLSFAHSVETSPALLPDRFPEEDREASATLMLLNNDRRNSKSSARQGVMSVRDLLSS